MIHDSFTLGVSVDYFGDLGGGHGTYIQLLV